MDADTKSILFNVYGGAIVSICTAILIKIKHWFYRFHLQRLLGFYFRPNTDVRLVYGQFMLPDLFDANGNRITHPYIKVPRRNIPQGQSFSIEHPVSECEVRASVYISSLLGSFKKPQTILTSDIQVDSLLDSNFISFGGSGSNFKTADILASEANIFIRDTGGGLSLIGGGNFPNLCTAQVDHGFILRITPPGFSGRSWIACVGLGEWGTSGSAWYLAHRWTRLIKRINLMAYYFGTMRIPDFMAIIRVTPGQDQSAGLVGLYRNDHGRSSRVI